MHVVSNDFTTFLPDEVISRILSHVPKAEYKSISLVCKKLKSIANDLHFWFPPPDNRTAKNIYQSLVDSFHYASLQTCIEVIKAFQLFHKSFPEELEFTVYQKSCRIFFSNALLKNNSRMFDVLTEEKLIDPDLVVRAASLLALSKNKIIFKKLIRYFIESYPNTILENLIAALTMKACKRDNFSLIEALIEEKEIVLSVSKIIIVAILGEKRLDKHLLKFICESSSELIIDYIFKFCVTGEPELYNQFKVFNGIHLNYQFKYAQSTLSCLYGGKILTLLFNYQKTLNKTLFSKNAICSAVQYGNTFLLKTLFLNSRIKADYAKIACLKEFISLAEEANMPENADFLRGILKTCSNDS